MLKGHGGDIYRAAKEAGIDPQKLIDLSGNINPLGPPKGLFEFLAQNLDLISRLPEPDLLSLRRAIARRLKLRVEEVFPAPGTTDWIYLLPAIFRPKEVVIFGPTYADYADAAAIWGIKVIYLMPQAPEAWPKLCLPQGSSKRLYFLCNPNNPTGGLLKREQILNLAETLKGQGILVVDESYLPFASGDEDSLAYGGLQENIIVLRSFSKIYAIPGLRLGCLLAPMAISPQLKPHVRPWWVGTLGAEVGIYLLEQKIFEDETRSYLYREKERIYQRLREIKGLWFLESTTTFILCRLRFPKVKELYNRLLRRGFLVRPCGNFVGLDDHYFRFSLKDPSTNDRFLKALEEELVDMD
ncbi:threonine-phosphate decarboxylase CobD [Thermosulfuriphilus sp.]